MTKVKGKGKKKRIVAIAGKLGDLLHPETGGGLTVLPENNSRSGDATGTMGVLPGVFLPFKKRFSAPFLRPAGACLTGLR
jgi:hypothetical protein